MSNCLYMGDYDDGPSVSQVVLRRARKPHRCCECNEEIPVGSLYEYATGCWDGYWGTFRTCARCCNLIRDYVKDGVRIYGALVEYWTETFGFDYREGIPRDFAPCAKTALAQLDDPR